MALGVTITSGEGLTADASLGGAASVEVYERLGEVTTFALRFPVTTRDGDLSVIGEASLSPGATIGVLVPTDAGTICLVKGPVTGQQIHLTRGGDGWVEVHGADSSATMDRAVRSQAWTDVTDADVVNSVASEHGFTPDTEATGGKSSERTHTLVQRDTDLRFVHRLARRNGFLFWVTCDGTTGEETAHFRRAPLDTPTGQVLRLTGPGSNLRSLDLKWDSERPTSVSALQLDLSTKEDIDGSAALTPQTLLGKLGLQAITGDTRDTLVAAAGDDAGAVLARAEGALVEADWFIQATGETTLRALGNVLRAHTVVELGGVGRRHSGRYLVAGVRHVIDFSGHRMVFELYRNAWEA